MESDNMEKSANSHLDHLLAFLKKRIEADSVLAKIDGFLSTKSSTAGSVRENVFTREFLCPAIAAYFYDEAFPTLGLEPEAIKSGLGAEGHRHCEGFGFTPNGKAPHLFHKGDIIKSEPPPEWFASGGTLSGKTAWPDFAIRSPLPLSLVGEVKYFSGRSPKTAVKELYNAARQVTFYLGALRGDQRYDAGLLVIADASPGHMFSEGWKSLKPELRRRFGADSGIHLLVVSLS